MKLCARQEIFASFHYGADVYKKMKELGCDYIDYPIGGSEKDSRLLEVKKQVEDAGLYIHQVHGPFRYPVHDETEALRAQRMDEMKRSIRGTALMGCKFWIIHPVFPFGESDFMAEETLRINEAFFRELLPTAKEYGVTICLENMPFKNFVLSTPEQILTFIRKIDDENFKFCLDTGHANVFGVQPADAVRMAGSDLKVLHVHDNNGKEDRHCLPYTGTVNWNDFMKALREVGYGGTLSLECNFLDPLGGFLPSATDEIKFQCFKAIVDGLFAEK